METWGPVPVHASLSGFDDVINTVVLQPTGVTALGIDDLIEKTELLVTSIHHIETVDSQAVTRRVVTMLFLL